MADLTGIIQGLSDALKTEDIAVSDLVQQGKKVNGMVHRGGLHLSIFYDSDAGLYGFNMTNGGSKTYEDLTQFVRMLSVYLYIHTYFLPNARKVADVFEKVIEVTTVYQNFEGNMAEGFLASFTVLGSAAKVLIREMKPYYIASYIVYPNDSDTEEVDAVFKYQVVDGIVSEIFTLDSYVKRLYNAYWDSEEFNISRLNENEFEVGYNGLQYTYSVEIVEGEENIRFHVSSYALEDNVDDVKPIENCVISLEDYMDLGVLSHRVRDFIVAHKSEINGGTDVVDNGDFDDSMLGDTTEETPVEETPTEELSVEETPVEEPPVEETPVEEPPIEEPQVEETPVEDVPVAEESIEETPVEEAVADEEQVEHINQGGIPVEGSVQEESVVEDTVAEEVVSETNDEESSEDEIKEDASESEDDASEQPAVEEPVDESSESATEETTEENEDVTEAEEESSDDSEEDAVSEAVEEVVTEMVESEDTDTEEQEVENNESEESIMQTVQGDTDFSISRLMVNGNYEQLVINMPNTVYLITREDAEAHGIPTERIADSEELKKYKGMLLSESEIRRGLFGEIITGKDDKIAEVVRALFS